MTSMTKKRPSLLAIPAITLAIALGVAGCGKNNSNGTDGDASALKYAQCMRAEGVSWYPDPQPNGNVVVSEPPGDDHAELQAAEQTCRKYNPINESNPVSSADLAKLRKMSQCMRDQGIAKYPDPATNGAVNINKSSGISPDDPSFKKALDVCRKYGPAAVQGS